MQVVLNNLKQQIASLNIADWQKEDLLTQLQQVEKAYIRAEFSMKRTLKDKAIIVNLLNKSIEDLQQQHEIVEQTNIQLFRQKGEIELKNKELEKQKGLIEEHSLKLKENIKELERSYSELEQFSYIASHDLKSPLRTIASYAQLLQRRYKGQLDDTADEFIDFIVMGANHMNNIICDLLEYSRAGKRDSGFCRTDLNNTLEAVKFNLRNEIQEAQAIVQHSKLPQLVVHKSSMMQLFQNLVANAIKFRRQEHTPIIDISSKKEAQYWHFIIQDNGVGMDESYQQKAFLPFQRLNNRERPGTGMGLAICKKIVKMHNGDIWYQSNKDKGTTFHFTIPDSENTPAKNMEKLIA